MCDEFVRELRMCVFDEWRRYEVSIKDGFLIAI